MLKNLADEMSIKMVANKTIDIDDRECYAYGLELLFSKVIFYVVTLILSFLTGAFAATLVFIVAYMWLRKYSGGYHCNTSEMCLLLSIIIVMINILIYKLSIDFINDATLIVWITAAVMAYIIILIFSPVASPNKPITSDERKKYKIITMLISSVIMTVAILSFYFKWYIAFFQLSYAIIIDSALIILTFLNKGGERSNVGNDGENY